LGASPANHRSALVLIAYNSAQRPASVVICPPNRAPEDMFAGSNRSGQRFAFMSGMIVTAKLNDSEPQAWSASSIMHLRSWMNCCMELAASIPQSYKPAPPEHIRRSSVAAAITGCLPLSLAMPQMRSHKVRERIDGQQNVGRTLLMRASPKSSTGT